MENLIAAMGRIDPNRLLDRRFIDGDAEGDDAAVLPECSPALIPIEILETI